jgi:hypothetical protein
MNQDNNNRLVAGSIPAGPRTCAAKSEMPLIIDHHSRKRDLIISGHFIIYTNPCSDELYFFYD